LGFKGFILKINEALSLKCELRKKSYRCNLFEKTLTLYILGFVCGIRRDKSRLYGANLLKPFLTFNNIQNLHFCHYFFRIRIEGFEKKKRILDVMA
jgi:hypothetical protein